MKSTIYYGGDILTLEEGNYAQAILVEDGIIKQVGDASTVFISKTPQTEMVDLKGKTLMPAFIDSHSHITALGNTFGMVDLSGASCFDEITDRIGEYKKQNHTSPKEWICGFGYDNNFLKEKRHPDKEMLDKVCKDNPIIISHVSGHMGVANSSALEKFDITKQTKDPKGGVIGRDDGGIPNGYLEETAFTSMTTFIPQRTLKQLTNQMKTAQKVYFQNGITTVQDGFTKKAEWELMMTMAKDQQLKADMISYIQLDGNHDLIEQYRQYQDVYNNHLKIGGYKIFLDGSPQGRTAYLSEPYENTQDNYCGYPVYSDEQVEDFMRIALKEDRQILVHCNGDAAAQQMIDAYQNALKHCPQHKSIRPVMIHAQLVRPDQLSVMKRLGMIASFFVDHTYYWGDIHIKNLGRGRAFQISPVASALKAGTKYTFHQDTPVSNPTCCKLSGVR